MSNQKVKMSFLALLICLLGYPQISETIYTPSLPDLAASLRTSMSTAEYTLSIYFVGFAFGVLVFGVLADILGRKKSMLLGLLIYTLASLGCSFCGSIESLLLMRFLQAFGAATGSVVTQTILRDLFSGAERRRVFAIASGALAFSPAMGPIIGGMVDQLWGWRANFLVLTLMGLILAIQTWNNLIETLKEPAPHSFQDTWNLGKKMARDPMLYFYGLLIGGCNGVIFGYYAEAPFLFIDILGMSPSKYGLMGLVVASSFILASFLTIRLNRLLPPSGTVTLGSTLALLGSASLTWVCKAVPLAHSAGLYAWISLFSSFAAIFVGIGLMIPNCLSQALLEYQAKSGSAGSLFGFSYYVLIAGITAGMGLLHDGSPHAMGTYFCFLTGSMFLLSGWRFLRDTQKS